MSSSRLRTIRSTQNADFKRWRRYIRSPEVATCPWIGIEGEKAIREVAGYQPIELLLATESVYRQTVSFQEGDVSTVILPKQLLRSISKLRSPQGLFAFFSKPMWTRHDLTSRVLYLDRLQDPGNLGTIFRSAASWGFSILTAPGTVSCFNDKLIRASAGYLFRVPFLEKVDWNILTQLGYPLWLADASRGQPLWDAKLTEPIILAVGQEGSGLSAPPGLGQQVHIPMEAGVESLNVAVSAALLMYEVHRRSRA